MLLFFENSLLISLPLFILLVVGWRILYKATSKLNDASYNVPSLVHSLGICAFVPFIMANDGYGKMVKLLMVNYSLSYFISDLVPLFYNKNVPGMIHHIFATYVSLYIYVKIDCYKLLCALVMIEASTPFLNIMNISKYHKWHPIIATLSGALLLITFTLFRIVAIPVIVHVWFNQLDVSMIGALSILYGLCIWWWLKILQGVKQALIKPSKILKMR